MNRRSVIKNILFVSAGASLIPACMNDKGKASFLLKNITVSGDQEKMIADLASIIIPTTDSPGAKELSSHLFVMMMVDDCYNNEGRQKFTKGMTAFEELVKKRYSTDFTKLTADQKKVLLTDVEAAITANMQAAQKNDGGKAKQPANNAVNDITADTTDFYNTVKWLTVESFVTSQYFLTKVQVYELVPGRYHGCVPVKTA